MTTVRLLSACFFPSGDFKLTEVARETPVAKVHKAGRCRAAKFLPLYLWCRLLLGLRAWCWLEAESSQTQAFASPIISRSHAVLSWGKPLTLNLQRKHGHRTPVAWHQKPATGQEQAGFQIVHLHFLCHCAIRVAPGRPLAWAQGES